MGVRLDATALGEARRRVEALVCDLPIGPGDRGFEEPWELRAFALAVAAYHNGQYDWSEFQLSLISAIQRWEADPDQGEPWSYYAHWLTALETVLSGAGVLDDQDVDARTRTVLAIPRNANHHHAHTEPVAIDPAR